MIPRSIELWVRAARPVSLRSISSNGVARLTAIGTLARHDRKQTNRVRISAPPDVPAAARNLAHARIDCVANGGTRRALAALRAWRVSPNDRDGTAVPQSGRTCGRARQ